MIGQTVEPPLAVARDEERGLRRLQTARGSGGIEKGMAKAVVSEEAVNIGAEHAPAGIYRAVRLS